MSQSSIFLERYEHHIGLVYLYCRIAIRWGLEAGTGFFFLFFQRQYTYYEVQYVVVGEEQRPDRWYHTTANMYRIVCKMGIASIQGHGTSAYLPRRRNLHLFFSFFFINLLFCCRAPPITQAHRTCAPSFITAQ